MGWCKKTFQIWLSLYKKEIKFSVFTMKYTWTPFILTTHSTNSDSTAAKPWSLHLHGHSNGYNSGQGLSQILRNGLDPREQATVVPTPLLIVRWEVFYLIWNTNVGADAWYKYHPQYLISASNGPQLFSPHWEIVWK